MKTKWICNHKPDHWTWGLYVNNKPIGLGDLRAMHPWLFELWKKLNPEYVDAE